MERPPLTRTSAVDIPTSSSPSEDLENGDIHELENGDIHDLENCDVDALRAVDNGRVVNPHLRYGRHSTAQKPAIGRTSSEIPSRRSGLATLDARQLLLTSELQTSQQRDSVDNGRKTKAYTAKQHTSRGSVADTAQHQGSPGSDPEESSNTSTKQHGSRSVNYNSVSLQIDNENLCDETHPPTLVIAGADTDFYPEELDSAENDYSVTRHGNKRFFLYNFFRRHSSQFSLLGLKVSSSRKSLQVSILQCNGHLVKLRIQSVTWKISFSSHD